MAKAPTSIEEFMALPVYERPRTLTLEKAEAIECTPDSIAFVVDPDGQGWRLKFAGGRLCRMRANGLFG